MNMNQFNVQHTKIYGIINETNKLVQKTIMKMMVK